MDIDYRRVPLATLREYARDRAEQSSLRQIASDIGVGRGTLQNFVRGETSPHPRVKRLVALWYLNERVREAEAATMDPFEAALEVMVGALPETRKRQAGITVVEIVERVHALLGVPLPPGLAELRRRLTSD